MALLPSKSSRRVEEGCLEWKWLIHSMSHVLCSEADEEGELEQLRRQFDHSEAARHALEKRVKEAGSMQQRLIMACTVGSVLVSLHTSIALLLPHMSNAI